MTTSWQTLTLAQKRDRTRELLEHPTSPATYKQAAAALGTTVGAIAHLVAESGDDPKGKIRSFRSSLPRSNVKRAPRPKPAVASIDDDEPMPVDTRPIYDYAWDALPGTQPVRLEDHATGCRWTVHLPGEAVARFCNEPTDGGRYCAAHHAMGTRPEVPPARRTVAGKVKVFNL